MRKIALSIICMLMCIVSANAQSLGEIFKDNKTLTDIFVNPLGIENVVEDNDFDALKAEIEKKGIRFNSLDLGLFGKVIGIAPSDMKIGGVPVGRMTILVQGDINGLMFQSASCSNYRDMCSFLDESLAPYAKSTADPGDSAGDIKVYMLSDKYGIGVGSIGGSESAIALLMDMKNLRRFLSLGGLFQTDPD